MTRMLCALAVALAAMGAAPPTSSPVELTPEQKRQLAALVDAGAQAERKGDYEAAHAAALAVWKWRAAAQGPNHWETVDERHLAEGFLLLARTPARDRPRLARTSELNRRLGDALKERRHKDALVLATEALRICRAVLGEDHPRTATSHSNVGVCHERLGEQGKALEAFAAALASSRNSLGDSHRDTATSHLALGRAQEDAGQVAAALSNFEKALKIRRKALGDRHPKTVEACYSVAFCLRDLRQYRRASEHFLLALAIRRDMLGEWHRDTGLAHSHAGVILNQLGMAGDSLKHHRKALAISRRANGETHGHTAAAYNNVADSLRALGQHEEALPLQEKALMLFRRVHGEYHQNTGMAYNNVGACLDGLGRHSQSLPLYEKGLAVFLKVLGEDHRLTANAHGNLAGCLRRLGQPGRALPHAEKALAIRLKALGEDHPDTGHGQAEVGACLFQLGQHARARAFLERASAISQGRFGEQHPESARHSKLLAQCLMALGEHEAALPLLARAASACERNLGQNDALTASVYVSLADCHQRLRRADKALPLYEKALEANRRALGETHLSTALAHKRIGSCLCNLGQPERAVASFEKALAICAKTHGRYHAATVGASESLATCLLAMGRFPEAGRLLQAMLPGYEVARHRAAESGFDRAVSEEAMSPHAMLAMILHALGQPSNAFRHAEASLGRALLDDLGRTNPDEAARMARIAGEIEGIDRRLVPLFGSPAAPGIDLLKEDLMRRRASLYEEQASIATAASTRRLASAREIQAALGHDDALVMWVDLAISAKGDGQPSACVLRRTGPPRWVRVPASGKEWSDADSYLPDQARFALLAGLLDGKARDALVAKEPPRLQALARAAFAPGQADKLLAALRTQRIKPLLPHLEGVKRLFVVPTGRMAAFPVELAAPGFSVSCIPSGSFLHRTLKGHRPLSADSLLALGDPVFAPPGGKIPQPPAAGLYIAAVVPGGKGHLAGLRAGDVLVAHGDKPLRTVDDLRGAGAGTLSVWREGKELARRIPAGTLGLSIDKDPPRVAIARRRVPGTPLAMRGTGHVPLPGTAYEVNALASLVKDATRLLGSAASEQALDALLAKKRLKEFRILHLATHGEVNEHQPDRSCLVLAQDALPDPLALPPSAKTYDGRLTVETIRRTWELDADLVVLSACGTALGRDANGDGLIGFAHAFLTRGARAVVLSRWKVDDGATALLMVRFYRNLTGKGGKKMGRAAAMLEAKEWLSKLPRAEAEALVAHLTKGTLRGEVEVPPLARDDPRPDLPKGDRPYADPAYWAAWALIGDPD